MDFQQPLLSHSCIEQIVYGCSINQFQTFPPKIVFVVSSVRTDRFGNLYFKASIEFNWSFYIAPSLVSLFLFLHCICFCFIFLFMFYDPYVSSLSFALSYLNFFFRLSVSVSLFYHSVLPLCFILLCHLSVSISVLTFCFCSVLYLYCCIPVFYFSVAPLFSLTSLLFFHLTDWSHCFIYFVSNLCFLRLIYHSDFFLSFITG